MPPDPKAFLVITPRADGADGISELTRQVVRGVERAAVDGVEIWALDGGPPGNAGPETRFWSAQGSRARIVACATGRAARGARGLTVLVLHVHLAPLARLLGSRGARITVFLAGVEVWTPLRARERHALERADQIVAISDFTVREFRRANPALAACRVTVCAPGIGSASPRGATEEVGSGYALIVGRMSSAERYKGHDALIAAWPAVRASVPGARLVVVGEGDDRPRLEAAAESTGAADAITFLGRVDDERLASVYAGCAFFVMPSSREGFGLVYLEAMRAGKPCIAVHGAADEIIRDGLDGVLLDSDAPGPLTAAVVRLFSDVETRSCMGASARRRVEEQFAEPRFTHRLLETLGAHPGGAGAWL